MNPGTAGLGQEGLFSAAKDSGGVGDLAQLGHDWSKLVTREGRQLVTVGSHWPLSRAFNRADLEGFLRIGTCLGCHQSMTDPPLWKAVATQGRLSEADHRAMMEKMLNAYRLQRVKDPESGSADAE